MSRKFHRTGKGSDLEMIVLIHVFVLVAGAAWMFGGNSPWVKTLIAAWGTLGMGLSALLTRAFHSRTKSLPRSLHLLWPLLVYNLIVVVSLFYPGYRTATYEGDILLIRNVVSDWLPSSAIPGRTLKALWLFDAIYLSCFNLLLAMRSRSRLRLLLYALVGNASLLAVFGSIQKLVAASGLFFGAQASPQTKFFASFIYHNHWGAFALLMIAIALGLFFRLRRIHPGPGLINTPAPLLLLAVALLAITIPLSGSRSCSLMGLLLLLAAGVHWVGSILTRKHSDHQSVVGATALAGSGLLAVFWIAYLLGEPMIRERWEETRTQVAQVKEAQDRNFRVQLYADTWSMAKERWLWGWGLGSYPVVFQDFNNQRTSPVDRLPKYFHDAHSDWLQSLAERGFAGTLLVGLCGLLPLWHHRRSLSRSPVIWYALGCGSLLLAYAWVEFPFGNSAVVCAFWLSLFTATAYGNIEADHSSG